MNIRGYAKLGVMMAGLVGLGIEMAAERLLSPAFGTTLDLWSIVIGLTFTFLSLGYELGGKLIDRRPTHRIIAGCLLIAGAWTVLIAFLGRPIVDQIQQWTFDFGGLRAGLFFSTLVLFTVPPFLLGIVTPAAIRLVVPQVGQAGSSAGTIYALGTIGSLVGTFVPVIVLMPRIGVRLTFLSMAAVALFTGVLGLTRAVSETTGNRQETAVELVGVGARDEATGSNPTPSRGPESAPPARRGEQSNDSMPTEAK